MDEYRKMKVDAKRLIGKIESERVRIIVGWMISRNAMNVKVVDKY